jgi:hypothetical protein
LLSDPSVDDALRLLIRSFEPIQETVVALKRVESLMAKQGTGLGHFQVFWKSLLEAYWVAEAAHNFGERLVTAAPKVQEFYSLWFRPSTLDKQLLSDLVRIAKLVSPAVAPADASGDSKKKSKRRARRGPRNMREFARFKTAIDKGIRKDRQKMDIALEFTHGDERKAKALLRQLQRHKQLPD